MHAREQLDALEGRAKNVSKRIFELLDRKFEPTRTLQDEERVMDELVEEAHGKKGSNELSELIREQGEIAQELLTALKDYSNN